MRRHSPYNYAFDNPVRFVDPDGMASKEWGALWLMRAFAGTSEEEQSEDLWENGDDDPPKKKGNMLANGPGSIIRKGSRSQLQRGDGSSDAFLDGGYELGTGFTPIGIFFDFKAAISGEDMSGEQLSPFWRLAGVVPFVSEFRKSRGLWNLTSEGAVVIKNHKTWGNFYKGSDGLWWSEDITKHGASEFKVFKETNNGLEWIHNADKHGDFIKNQHKSSTGTFIPWGQLKTVK